MFAVEKRRVVIFSLLGAGCAAYGTFRIWQAVLTPPAVWQDSLDYRTVSKHGWFTAQLWTGSRAPVVPILLKLTHSFVSFGILQAIVGALAWSLLALTASRLVKEDWRCVFMAWAVLGLGTSTLVIQWDWSVLSESLSLSAEAVICATAIWLVRRFSWVRLALLGLAVVAYVGIRDADIWDIAIVAIVLLAIGVNATIRGAALGPRRVQDVIKARWQHTRRWILVGMALLVPATVAQLGAYAAHRNTINIEHVLYVRVFPYPDRVAWFSNHGMPDGSAIDTLARETPYPPKGNAKVVGIDLTDPRWQSLVAWFDQHAETAYVLFLATHPIYVFTAPFGSPPLTYNNAMGHLSFYDPVHSRPLDVVEYIFAPNYLGVVGLALLAIAAVWRRKLWRQSELALLVTLAVVGLVSMLLSWHGDGEEVTRHMVEGDVAVRLSVMLMLLFAVFGPSVSQGSAARSESTPDLQSSDEPAVENGDLMLTPTVNGMIEKPLAT